MQPAAASLRRAAKEAPPPGATPGQVAERARRAIGQELDMVADLVGHGTLAASLPMLREGWPGRFDREVGR